MTTRFKQVALEGFAHVVHGWIESNDMLIKHAWIEFTDPAMSHEIYEPVNQTFIDKTKVKCQPVKRYSYIELMKLSIKTNSKGGVFEF